MNLYDPSDQTIVFDNLEAGAPAPSCVGPLLGSFNPGCHEGQNHEMRQYGGAPTLRSGPSLSKKAEISAAQGGPYSGYNKINQVRRGPNRDIVAKLGPDALRSLAHMSEPVDQGGSSSGSSIPPPKVDLAKNVIPSGLGSQVQPVVNPITQKDAIPPGVKSLLQGYNIDPKSVGTCCVQPPLGDKPAPRRQPSQQFLSPPGMNPPAAPSIRTTPSRDSGGPGIAPALRARNATEALAPEPQNHQPPPRSQTRDHRPERPQPPPRSQTRDHRPERPQPPPTSQTRDHRPERPQPPPTSQTRDHRPQDPQPVGTNQISGALNDQQAHRVGADRHTGRNPPESARTRVAVNLQTPTGTAKSNAKASLEQSNTTSSEADLSRRAPKGRISAKNLADESAVFEEARAMFENLAQRMGVSFSYVLERFIDRNRHTIPHGTSTWNQYQTYWYKHAEEEEERAGGLKGCTACYWHFHLKHTSEGTSWPDIVKDLVEWDRLSLAGKTKTDERKREFQRLLKQLNVLAQSASNHDLHLISILVGGDESDLQLGSVVKSPLLSDVFEKRVLTLTEHESISFLRHHVIGKHIQVARDHLPKTGPGGPSSSVDAAGLGQGNSNKAGVVVAGSSSAPPESGPPALQIPHAVLPQIGGSANNLKISRLQIARLLESTGKIKCGYVEYCRGDKKNIYLNWTGLPVNLAKAGLVVRNWPIEVRLPPETEPKDAKAKVDPVSDEESGSEEETEEPERGKSAAKRKIRQGIKALSALERKCLAYALTSAGGKLPSAAIYIEEIKDSSAHQGMSPYYLIHSKAPVITTTQPKSGSKYERARSLFASNAIEMDGAPRLSSAHHDEDHSEIEKDRSVQSTPAPKSNADGPRLRTPMDQEVSLCDAEAPNSSQIELPVSRKNDPRTLTSALGEGGHTATSRQDEVGSNAPELNATLAKRFAQENQSVQANFDPAFPHKVHQHNAAISGSSSNTPALSPTSQACASFEHAQYGGGSSHKDRLLQPPVTYGHNAYAPSNYRPAFPGTAHLNQYSSETSPLYTPMVAQNTSQVTNEAIQAALLLLQNCGGLNTIGGDGGGMNIPQRMDHGAHMYRGQGPAEGSFVAEYERNMDPYYPRMTSDQPAAVGSRASHLPQYHPATNTLQDSGLHAHSTWHSQSYHQGPSNLSSIQFDPTRTPAEYQRGKYS